MSFRSNQAAQISRLSSQLSMFESLLGGYPQEVIDRVDTFIDIQRMPYIQFKEVPGEFELKDALEQFAPEPLWVCNLATVMDNQPPEVVTRDEIAEGLRSSVWPIGPLRTIPLSTQGLTVQWVTQLQGKLAYIRLVRAPLSMYPGEPISISSQSVMTGYDRVCVTNFQGDMTAMMWLAAFKTKRLGTFQPEALDEPLEVALALMDRFFNEERPKFKGAPPLWVMQAYLDAWLPQSEGATVSIQRKSSVASTAIVEFWLRHNKRMECITVSRDQYYGEELPGLSSWDEAPWIEMADGVTLR